MCAARKRALAEGLVLALCHMCKLRWGMGVRNILSHQCEIFRLVCETFKQTAPNTARSWLQTLLGPKKGLLRNMARLRSSWNRVMPHQRGMR